MIRWTIAALVAAALSCASTARADNLWGGYHWPRTPAFTLTVEDDLTGPWQPFLTAVSTDWSTSSVLDTTVTNAYRVSRRQRRRCAPILGQVVACNAKYGFNGWLGIAEVWIYTSTKHIAQARVRINDSYFALAKYNDPFAKRHVLCQEIGHTLGLDHQYDVTCMNDVDGLFDPAYVSPNTHDFGMLATLYSHAGTAAAEPDVHNQGDGTRVLTWIFKP